MFESMEKRSFLSLVSKDEVAFVVNERQLYDLLFLLQVMDVKAVQVASSESKMQCLFGSYRW